MENPDRGYDRQQESELWPPAKQRTGLLRVGTCREDVRARLTGVVIGVMLRADQWCRGT